MLTGLAGPAAYAVDTAVTAHDGAIPTAGPATAGGRGGFPGGLPATGAGAPGGGRPRGGGGVGGRATDPALDALLRASTTRWSAATVGAMGGAQLALSSGTDVMSIGGFMGSDPAPTLQQFQAAVAAGNVHYFVESGGVGPQAGKLPPDVRADPRLQPFLGQSRPGGGFGGRGGTGSEITTWVQQNFTPSTVGGRTVYDLTKHR